MSDDTREPASPAEARLRELLAAYARTHPGGPPVVRLDHAGRIHEDVAAVLRRLGPSTDQLREGAGPLPSVVARVR